MIPLPQHGVDLKFSISLHFFPKLSYSPQRSAILHFTFFIFIFPSVCQLPCRIRNSSLSLLHHGLDSSIAQHPQFAPRVSRRAENAHQTILPPRRPICYSQPPPAAIALSSKETSPTSRRSGRSPSRNRIRRRRAAFRTPSIESHKTLSGAPEAPYAPIFGEFVCVQEIDSSVARATIFFLLCQKVDTALPGSILFFLFVRAFRYCLETPYSALVGSR